MSSRKNIFGLQNPEEYVCKVWSYLVSHSMLLVRIHQGSFEEKVLYLTFQSVQYFEGPLMWKSANFYSGNPDECLKLLQQRGLKGMPEDDLLEGFRLYVVDLPDFGVVKILAASKADINSSIPGDFLA